MYTLPNTTDRHTYDDSFLLNQQEIVRDKVTQLWPINKNTVNSLYSYFTFTFRCSNGADEFT